MVKNIIFDLGGVLFRINYNRTFVQLGKLVGQNLSVGFWPDWFKSVVLEYETGMISTERFLLTIQMKSQCVPVPQGNDLVKAWNAMLIGWQDGVFDVLQDLSVHYNLYILSNINALHEQQLKYSYPCGYELDSIFKKIYFSHKIGLRKPDKRCFELILDENKILPDETLFIDDYPKNILEAREMGLHCVVHQSNEDINNKIKKYIDLDC